MIELHHVIDPARPAAVIVDVDGTLADATHRQHFLERSPKDYESFFAHCHADPLFTHIGVIVNLLSNHYKILITTGRTAKWLPHTRVWLTKQRIEFHAAFSRANNDYRPDDVVKEEILDRDILPNYTPIFALDDRSSVVKMWRRRGIPCLQVAEGDY